MRPMTKCVWWISIGGRSVASAITAADTANSRAAIQLGIQRRPTHALNSTPQTATSVSDGYRRDGV